MEENSKQKNNLNLLEVDPLYLREVANKNLIVNYLPNNISNKQFHNLFKEHGHILSSKVVRDDQGVSLGYGFIEFSEIESAYEAIRRKNGFELEGKILKVSYARVSSPHIKNCKLYLSNLPSNTTEADLIKVFEKFGEIIECRVPNMRFSFNGIAFIQYALREQAEAALTLNGTILGDRKISVKFAANSKTKNFSNNTSRNMSTDSDYNSSLDYSSKTQLNSVSIEPEVFNVVDNFGSLSISTTRNTSPANIPTANKLSSSSEGTPTANELITKFHPSHIFFPSQNHYSMGYPNPGYGTPGYSTPGYGTPGYLTPGYVTPSYTTPYVSPSNYVAQKSLTQPQSNQGKVVVFVYNIPPFMTASNLQELFSQTSEIISVDIVPLSGIAKVVPLNVFEANKLCSTYNNYALSAYYPPLQVRIFIEN